MPVPAVRAAHLVVVQPRLLLGGLEGVLDAPAATGHGHECLQVAALQREGHVDLLGVRVRQGRTDGRHGRLPPAPPDLGIVHVAHASVGVYLQ